MGSPISDCARDSVRDICSNAYSVYPIISRNTSAVCVLAITRALGAATVESPNRTHGCACVVVGLSGMVIWRCVFISITER